MSGPKHCNLTRKYYNNNKNNNQHIDGLNGTFLESNIFQLTSEQSNLTSQQNLTTLVDDFLTQICRFQVFSGIEIRIVVFMITITVIRKQYLAIVNK